MEKTIFIVDDSITNLSATEEILERYYRVITMTSAAKMFTILEMVTPDLILLDVAMPDMSGFDAMKQLKTNEEHAKIPIIFFTALADSHNEAYGIEIGAVDFITKPFSESVLLHRIKYHLNIDELIKERTEQLERANNASKAKGEFLSSMSNELRAPLNAIFGMTTIGKKAKDTDGKNQILNRIGEASSQLLGTVDDVLDILKIEANELEFSHTEYNFDRMLQKVMDTVSFRMVEKQQLLTIHVDKNVPLYLIGDEKRLSHVITNLMFSAVKSTPDGGQIRFDVSLLDDSEGQCTLRLVVEDNGIGLSKEQQKKLFKSNEHETSGSDNEFSGTYLGLIISKRIIELMDGKIWVESELGKGTKFIFTLTTERGRSDISNTDIDRRDSRDGQDMVGGCDRRDGQDRRLGRTNFRQNDGHGERAEIVGNADPSDNDQQTLT